MIKKIFDWEHWGIVFTVIFWGAIIVAIIYFIFFNKKDSDTITNSTLTEEEQRQKEQFDQQMKVYCSKSVSEMSGVDLYRCRDQIVFDIGGSSMTELLNTRPNIPNFCDRKIVEMKTNELAECIDEADLRNNENE